MKQILSLFLSLTLALGLAMPAAAAGEKDTVTVLYTNDVHTHLDQDLTYATLAAYSATLDDPLLVDTGDHIQGTAYGTADKGATIVSLMNAAGYDLAIPGNHEFDYGMEGFQNARAWADFPYVSCNFFHEQDGVRGDTVLAPYALLESNGVTLAFVGVTTPETFTSSTPAYFQDGAGNYLYAIVGGADGGDLYAAVQTAIDAARQEADYVIALAHLGVDPSSGPWTSEALIAHTTGLDALIDGHSHTAIPARTVTDGAGEPVLLTQTGSYLGAIGELTIASDGTLSARLLSPEDLAHITPDPALAETEGQWIAALEAQLGQKIGHTTEVLDNYDPQGNRLVRSQETNTGDFVTDALYHCFDAMDLPVDVAIMNGGGIRNQAITGDLSYQSCQAIHPYGNVACLLKVTGQQILDALEWGAKSAGQAEDGAFLQVSGLTYTIDTTVPSTVQKDDKGVWAGGPTGEYRVKDVQIRDRDTGAYEPLDLGATYHLAGYNYTLRDLGDGFAMFAGAENVVDYVKEDYLILADYIRAFPGAELTGYGQTQGRITLQTAASTQPEPQPQPPVQPETAYRAYVVLGGDTLWGIAQRHYGMGALWETIYQANRDTVKDPNLIFIGQQLMIPVGK